MDRFTRGYYRERQLRAMSLEDITCELIIAQAMLGDVVQEIGRRSGIEHYEISMNLEGPFGRQDHCVKKYPIHHKEGGFSLWFSIEDFYKKHEYGLVNAMNLPWG